MLFLNEWIFRKWEEVDHDLAGTIAGSMGTGPGSSNSAIDENPLGLGRRIECVIVEIR